MRHLATLGFFLGAAVAYMFGIGPLFFGAPLLGSVLVLAGIVCEVIFWRRLVRSRTTSGSPNPPSARK